MDSLINPLTKARTETETRKYWMAIRYINIIHSSPLYTGSQTRQGFLINTRSAPSRPQSGLPVLLQWSTRRMATQGMSPLNFFWGKYSLSPSLSLAFLFLLFVPFSVNSFFSFFSLTHLSSICFLFSVYLSAVSFLSLSLFVCCMSINRYTFSQLLVAIQASTTHICQHLELHSPIFPPENYLIFRHTNICLRFCLCNTANGPGFNRPGRMHGRWLVCRQPNNTYLHMTHCFSFVLYLIIAISYVFTHLTTYWLCVNTLSVNGGR